MRLIPKNWREFQHYKDRSPPWIRLQRKLLDDRDFHSLPVASRALAPMLWLLASESVSGEFNGDPAELAFRLRSTTKEVAAALRPLLEIGFFIPVQPDSTVLADGLRGAVPETEAETEQRQTPLPPDGGMDGFDKFYAAYPRKVAPDKARKAFEKVAPDETALERMLDAIEAQKSSPEWLKEGGQFIPYPASWLNAGQWKNGIAMDGGSSVAWHETRGGVEKRAASLGIAKWDECEQWPFYRARVVAAAREAA